MRHFPLYRDLRGRRVIVSGGGGAAVAKLRLLLKTEARIDVFAPNPAPEIRRWAAKVRINLFDRPIAPGDARHAVLLYGASGNADEDERAAAIGRAEGALVNIVDDLEGSDFITPAIVDRDPVTVAICTEGAAPALARQIKTETEAWLSPAVGTLAQVAREFRPKAEALPAATRRHLWSRFFEEDGPRALEEGGPDAARTALATLLGDLPAGNTRLGRVWLAGAGPGDPELLTLKVRKLLDKADVVIHDRLVGIGVLELARREATLIQVGKAPCSSSWRQEDINALMIAHAQEGADVLRLKSGDPGIFGRLDEEIEALDEAGVTFEVVPGVTSAAAAAAAAKVSLTRRERNSSIEFLTGRDVDGLAEHDWGALAKPRATAAIYMGVRAAEFIRGRLLMHGAARQTPVTAVENASRPEQKIVSGPLDRLPEMLSEAGLRGPAILFLGLCPRNALGSLDNAKRRSEETMCAAGSAR